MFPLHASESLDSLKEAATNAQSAVESTGETRDNAKKEREQFDKIRNEQVPANW